MTDHAPDKPLIGSEVHDTRWVYYSGFYDGPLSGVVNLPDGTRAWAECAEECTCRFVDEDTADGPDCGWYRRYQLYRLTDAVWAIEDERHADFQRWVGTHTDIDEGAGRRRVGEVRAQSLHRRFYSKWLNEPDVRLDDATPIGWCER